MKIAMIGAGSFFTDAITEGLCASPFFEGCEFVLMDIDSKLLHLSLIRNREMLEKSGRKISIRATSDRRDALRGASYVVTACEKKRVPYWIQDIEIPERFGVRQFKGENGGPGGQAHGLRNITMFMEICKDMEEVCPDAWLMNFTNPMSFVCTYFHRSGRTKSLGFCHQVHGSLGVVSEMIGLNPGDLTFITAGVNHFNWLLDIRRKGSSESCMEWFLDEVRKCPWMKKVQPNIPANRFTLELLNTTGLYCVGYDDHICEYLPFFYPSENWRELGYTPEIDEFRKIVTDRKRYQKDSTEEDVAQEQSLARKEMFGVPFPRDGHHPWYRENPTLVMETLESGGTAYLDSIVIPNNGAVDNLPTDSIADVPAFVANGEVRSIHAGKLPLFAMELCRRQITIHELVTQAAMTGDRTLFVQSLLLDPYVRTPEQARGIADAFLEAYKEELPQFHRCGTAR